jgi:hypothetical protein
VKQRIAAALIGRDDEKLRTMLEGLQAETTDALENLRDLARGIYPPLLADKGLVEALTAQARKASIPVHVESDGIGRYPQEIESGCTSAASRHCRTWRSTRTRHALTFDCPKRRRARVRGARRRPGVRRELREKGKRSAGHGRPP